MQKQYSGYKGSGIPWMPIIPSHWNVSRAKYMFRKEKRDVRQKDKVITCFRDGQVTLRENRRTTGFTESITEIGYQGIRKGDLVIHQMDAFAGSIGVSDSDGKGTSVYHCCTPTGPFLPEYYAYALREMARNGYIQSLYRGIRERSSDFTFQTFGKQLLPVPPLSEQRIIVDYLERNISIIESLKCQREKELQTLTELKQAEIATAVTHGLNADVALKDSGIPWIGQIPAHWVVRRFKTICSLIRDSAFPGDMKIALENIESGTGKYIPTSSLFEGDGVHFEPGDILFGKLRPYLAKVYMAEYAAQAVGDFYVFRAKESVLPSYLQKLIISAPFIGIVNAGTYGAKMPRASWEDIAQLSVPLPPIDEQSTIVAHIESITKKIDKMIESLRTEIERLSEYKQRLISDVVTGQINVQD